MRGAAGSSGAGRHLVGDPRRAATNAKHAGFANVATAVIDGEHLDVPEFRTAGFRNVRSCTVAAPVELGSAAECLRIEKESFGALHQMLGGLDAAAKEAAWQEIEQSLRQFEGQGGFASPCELIVAVGSK